MKLPAITDDILKQTAPDWHKRITQGDYSKFDDLRGINSCVVAEVHGYSCNYVYDDDSYCRTCAGLSYSIWNACSDHGLPTVPFKSATARNHFKDVLWTLAYHIRKDHPDLLKDKPELEPKVAKEEKQIEAHPGRR